MNQTHRPQVMHKVIFHAIWILLITLATGYKIVTHTSNGDLERNLLSNQTILFIIQTMNPRIVQSIAPIFIAPKTLLTPATKGVVADTVLGDALVNSTLRQVSQAGVDGSGPCNFGHTVNIKHAPYQVLIVIVGTSPTCGIKRSL